MNQSWKAGKSAKNNGSLYPVIINYEESSNDKINPDIS
jgi:hypothetical protein